MRILNIEDEASKSHKICQAVHERGYADAEIEWVQDLKSGLKKIRNAITSGQPYDLIITDMWYPSEPDGDEEESGEILIQKAAKEKWNIPIILCSSQDYYFPEILGVVWYSEASNWEQDLISLIKRIG